MSEQTTAPAVKRRKKTSNILFCYTGKEYFAKGAEVQPEQQGLVLHPAAAAWLDVIKEAGKPVGRDECLQLLQGRNTGTSQPVIRILYYWKKALIQGGWITTTKTSPVAEVAEPAAEVATV